VRCLSAGRFSTNLYSLCHAFHEIGKCAKSHLGHLGHFTNHLVPFPLCRLLLDLLLLLVAQVLVGVNLLITDDEFGRFQALIAIVSRANFDRGILVVAGRRAGVDGLFADICVPSFLAPFSAVLPLSWLTD